MSEIIRDLQQQSVDSELINLYDLKLDQDLTIHFHPGEEDVIFDGNTYTPLPIQADGYEIGSDGAYSRPTLTIANLESVFKDSILGIKLEDLTGKYITRRRTLKKYLGTSVEFPSTKYIIDRLKSKNIISVTFELAIPFDLAGIKFPRRYVIGTSCPWRYRGFVEGHDSGCSWDYDFKEFNKNIYVNKYDEYLVYAIQEVALAFSGSANTNQYVTTVGPITQINSDGTKTTITKTFYWQCVFPTTSSPPENPEHWREVHPLNPYSSAGTYRAYTDSKYNDYVLYNDSVYQVKTITLDPNEHPSTPELGLYWTSGDVCGKKVQSCKARYYAISDGRGAYVSPRDVKVVLPFGGFPAAMK